MYSPPPVDVPVWASSRYMAGAPCLHQCVGCPPVPCSPPPQIYGMKLPDHFSLIGNVGLEDYERCLKAQRLSQTEVPSRPIVCLTYARVGLMGNPSDGFFGKTISLSIANYWAETSIVASERLVRMHLCVCVGLRRMRVHAPIIWLFRPHSPSSLCLPFGCGGVANQVPLPSPAPGSLGARRWCHTHSTIPRSLDR